MKYNSAILQEEICLLMILWTTFQFPGPANTTQPDTTDGELAQALETDRGDGRVSLKNKVAKEEIGSKRQSCCKNME